MLSMSTRLLFSVLAILAHPTVAKVVSRDTLFITSEAPTAETADCLKSSYYGTFGGSSTQQDHIYLPPKECLSDRSTLSGFKEGRIAPLESDDQSRLVWVGQAGLDGQGDGSLRMENDDWLLISSQIEQWMAGTDLELAENQHVLQSASAYHKRPIALVHQTSNSLLLDVPPAFLPILDTFLPRHLVPVALPSKPLPVTATGWEPVPDKFARHLANITSHLQFSPEIDTIVSEGINLNRIRRDVRWITGEAPSGIVSRHSFTPSAVKAAHWIKSKVEATGASCSLQPFLHGFAPNVICEYPSLSNSTERVIFSAHYDSRGSFGSTRAPGGNDDGSGLGHLLSLAHAIGSYGIKFDKAVTLAWFAGEEQGLFGSHAYAEYLHSQNATILLQVQADMIAYHTPGEPSQLALPEIIHLPEASYLVGNLSQMYSPELVVGKTSACCSDHQSFISYGFPATQVSERNGPIADPMYHNSGDITQREGYDFEQVVSFAKVTLATLLTVAGYHVAK
ncbi:hypothetical protein L204_103860 [Cryptococcus depauperatus]|nr:aminopeptidase [Cryptococcus depauperatus CBS 7855]